MEESDDRGEKIVQFRNEVRRLSFKKNSVRRRSSCRVPLRDRTREHLVTNFKQLKGVKLYTECIAIATYKLAIITRADEK